jgi:heptosyltransferase-2
VKLLVVQTSFLGDCVLSLDFLHELLILQADAKITWLTSPRGAEVVKLALERGLKTFNTRVHVEVFDKRGTDSGLGGLFALRRRLLRTGAFERAYCLQRSFRSGLLTWLCGARRRIGFSSGAASFFYTDPVRRDWMGGMHEIEKNRALLKLDYETTSFNGKRQSFLAQGAPARLQKYCAISIGSPWATKAIPVDVVVGVAQKILDAGFAVTLVGDASQFSTNQAQAIEARCRHPLFKNQVGRTQLSELIDLLQGATVVLSPDSAPVHLASDLNVPVVALFGPTVPELGFAPWRKGSWAIGVKDLACRPCDIHGPKICPLVHHKCMREMPVDKISKYLMNFFEARPLPSV